MSRRSHTHGQSQVVTRAGFNRSHGYCVPHSITRAILPDADDTDAAVRVFPEIVSRLRASNRLRKGSWFGGISGLAEAAGIRGGKIRRMTAEGNPWNGRLTRTAYPTLAQVLRKHDDFDRAVIFGTRHAGYAERQPDGTVRVYDMGARKRVDSLLILDGAEAPEELLALAAGETETPEETPEEETAPEETPETDELITFRYATVTNVRTGRPNRILVNRDGGVPESDQKRIGAPAQVRTYTVVRARTQREAGRLYRDGQGVTRVVR